MSRKNVVPSLLLALALFGCSSGEQRIAGGDDMGNFLRARLADSTGRPLSGRIAAFSDVDSISTELDAEGVLVLPSRHRAWLAMRTPQGAEFLLHAPPDSGRIGAFRLGWPRPLVGWLMRIATLRIAGVGTVDCDGGIFRFAAVPPGIMRLEAFSGSFHASVLLSTAFDTANLEPSPVDSFVTPPLTISDTLLVEASREDTTACGSACPPWFLDSANVIGEVPDP